METVSRTTLEQLNSQWSVKGPVGLYLTEIRKCNYTRIIHLYKLPYKSLHTGIVLLFPPLTAISYQCTSCNTCASQHFLRSV